jgi:hypothetical protein
MGSLLFLGMELEATCDCGHDIPEFIQGDTSRKVTLECVNCRAVWTLTITNIRPGPP